MKYSKILSKEDFLEFENAKKSLDYDKMISLILFALTTLFSFVTLPVEINASHRALVWLSSAGITSSMNHGMAQDALKWAAYTYVVAALGSLATLLYYIMIFMGGSRD